MRYLDKISDPADLQRFSERELTLLSDEVREAILSCVSETGGHLAASLGTVELTVALHSILESPRDKIVWDVGHQCYTHKLLTGRRDRFGTIRQYGGLSGFPNRAESPHDVIGTGHASTSIGYGLGLVEAGRIAHEGGGNVVCVLGDGALTGGVAFEALNQAGHLQKNIIVVLNDNEMSIDPNVGALSSFLSRKLSTKSILRMKKEIEIFLRSFPRIGEEMVKVAKRAEDALKGFFTPGMLFEAMNFQYFGPIDGHRIDQLVETFNNIKDINSPIIVFASHGDRRRGHLTKGRGRKVEVATERSPHRRRLATYF